jgi:hypothetical protein
MKSSMYVLFKSHKCSRENQCSVQILVEHSMEYLSTMVMDMYMGIEVVPCTFRCIHNFRLQKCTC